MSACEVTGRVTESARRSERSRSWPLPLGTTASLVFLIASFSPLLATPPSSPITLSLKLVELDPAQASGEVAIEVVSILDAPATRVTLVAPAGLLADTEEWTVYLRAGAPVTLGTKWAFSSGSGNLAISARAHKQVGPPGSKTSWGDMESIPLHLDPALGILSEGWKVDHVPVAAMGEPGDAVTLSMEPTPFKFPDLSDTPASDAGSWPSATAAVSSEAPSPPETAATVTLTGNWGYQDRSGVVRPADQQIIEIRRGDGAPLPTRVFCFTATNGDYSCSFPHPGTTFRVWLRSWTNLNPGPTRLGVFSGIEIPGGCGSDSIDCTYANSTPEIFCPDGSTCSLGSRYVAAGNEPWSGAHQMTQDLIRSWKKILFDAKHPAGTHSGPAKITYPTPQGHGPHAHTFNEGSETTGDCWISIPAPFQTAADVVAHEYGHAVMDNLWHTFTPNWTIDDCPSPHYIGLPSGYGCALSEGFADYWSWYSNELYDGDGSAANNGPIYDDPGFSTDFETRDNGTYASGDQVEGNVAAVFGDMMDSANEGPPPGAGSADRMRDGIQHIWHVMYSRSMANWQTLDQIVYSTTHDPGPFHEVMDWNNLGYAFLLNDTCVNAKAIAGAGFSETVNAWVAGSDSTDPGVSCGNGSRARSIFYKWTAPSAGTLTANTFGSDYDTILSAHGGSCGSFFNLSCNDDTGGLQSQVSFLVAPGDSITFMVSSFNGGGGSLTFNLSFAAVPPANDDCSAATPVASPSSSTAYTTGATVGGGDPTPSCGNGSNGRSAWYRFTAPGPGTLTVDTLGSDYDTILSAYTGRCGAFLAEPGGCNDDFAPPQRYSRIDIPVSPGVTFYFMASAYSNDGGSLRFNLTFTPAVPPNDDCSTATSVTTYPYADVAYTLGATDAAPDPSPPCGNQSRSMSVWYQFTAPTSGTLLVSTFGSSYDTILSAWAGSCGALTNVGCNDDTGGTQSELVVALGSGTTVRFMVTSYAGTGGTLNFSLDFAADAGHVPDGGLFPGTPLEVSLSGGRLFLDWSPSCLSSDTDYEVYEGQIGVYYSHAAINCSTGGATSLVIFPPAYSAYYLVVPRNSHLEGSYGLDSSGGERPQGSSACAPQSIGGC